MWRSMKRVNLTERMRFDIGAQAFNLFNHAQFVGGYLSDVRDKRHSAQLPHSEQFDFRPIRPVLSQQCAERAACSAVRFLSE